MPQHKHKIDSSQLDPAQIREGEARAIEIATSKIILCRWQGELYAFDNICSHDQAPLCDPGDVNATIHDGEIECPRHGARFDVTTGQAMCLPAIAPIETYGVRVSQGEIELDL